MEVSGQLKIGEAQPTLRNVRKRQLGSRSVFYILLVALILGGMLVGVFLTFLVDIALDAARIHHHWDIEPAVGGWLGIVAGAVFYQFVCKRMALTRFRKRLIGKGTPAELPLRMQITPDDLLYSLGGVRHAAAWQSVSELFPSRGYWIFLVDSTPWFALRRFFADIVAQRAFVRDALAHMSEAARSRSADAVAFAQVE